MTSTMTAETPVLAAETIALRTELNSILDFALPARDTAYSVNGKIVPIEGEYEGRKFVGVMYDKYDAHNDAHFKFSVYLYEGGEIKFGHPEKEGMMLSHVNEMKEKILAAAERDRECYFGLKEFMQMAAEYIGSPVGFSDSIKTRAPKGVELTERELRKIQTYKAGGTGGVITITVVPSKHAYSIRYKSGVGSRQDEILMTDFQHAASYLRMLEKTAKIAKVWHIGACTKVQQRLAAIPTHMFRHNLVQRPSYHHDVPLVDFVLADCAEILLLRVMEDGYKFWRNGEFVTTEDVNDILKAEQVTKAVEADKPWLLWRKGTGLLLTSGVFRKEGPESYSFTPFKSL
ncbi:hypothetical protein D3C80_745190 [compost metagenome]